MYGCVIRCDSELMLRAHRIRKMILISCTIQFWIHLTGMPIMKLAGHPALDWIEVEGNTVGGIVALLGDLFCNRTQN